jgi:hypothetical protein
MRFFGLEGVALIGCDRVHRFVGLTKWGENCESGIANFESVGVVYQNRFEIRDSQFEILNLFAPLDNLGRRV